MKNLLFSVLFLFSLNVNSQIPDSLNMTLPWSKIYVADCNNFAEPPRSTFDYIYVSNAEVIEINDSNNACLKTIQTWDIINWNNAEVYNYIQLTVVLDDYPITCEESYEFLNENFPVEITPSDIIQNYNENFEYSFSQQLLITSLLVEETIENFDLYVYNHSDSTFCKTNIHVNYCEDNLIFEVPDSVEIVFNEEHYIPLEIDDFNVTIEYPCGIENITLKSGGFSNYPKTNLYAFEIGQDIEISVELLTVSGKTFTKKINAVISGTPPPPVPMYIEDKQLEAGVETTL